MPTLRKTLPSDILQSTVFLFSGYDIIASLSAFWATSPVTLTSVPTHPHLRLHAPLVYYSTIHTSPFFTLNDPHLVIFRKPHSPLPPQVWSPFNYSPPSLPSDHISISHTHQTRLSYRKVPKCTFHPFILAGPLGIHSPFSVGYVHCIQPST